MNSDKMLHARLQTRFAPGPESAGFSLDVEFSAGPGVTVLYGASGAGKTITLDCIAGFLKPDAGRVLLNDRILFDGAAHVCLKPRERECGYVFQNYALFPHMSLRENLVFAAEKRPRLDRHRFINEMLDRFRLTEFAGRYPHEVSGGQKQRCSIARALIGSPKALLLDEPSKGLDTRLRGELYALLRELQRDFPIPILLVTHDLNECFALGENLHIYFEGRIVQSGKPREVWVRPKGVEVARILGYTNLFDAEILALDPGRNSSRLVALGQELTGTYYPGTFIGDRVSVCVDASDLRPLGQSGPNRVPLRLLCVSERPQGFRLEFSRGIEVEMPRREFESQRENREWFVEFPPGAIRLTG